MRVIVIECDGNMRGDVITAFTDRGHTVTPVDSIDEAKRWIEAGIVDVVVADLASASADESALMRSVNAQRNAVPLVLTSNSEEDQSIESLRAHVAEVLFYPWDDEAIDDAIEKIQTHHLLHGDALKVMPFLSERIEFAIPSRVEYLDGVLNHLSERLTRMGIIEPDSIEVVVALDEAIVNAIKHGNGYDPAKRVTVVAEISTRSATFTIEDEGDGFRPQDVPDPCAPENLLRTSGRGLLLINNIMDEVRYNERGNVLTMVKHAPCDKPSGVGRASSSPNSGTSDSQPLN